MTETYVRAGKINWIAKGSDVGVQERTLAPGEVIPWQLPHPHHRHDVLRRTAGDRPLKSEGGRRKAKRNWSLVTLPEMDEKGSLYG